MCVVPPVLPLLSTRSMEGITTSPVLCQFFFAWKLRKIKIKSLDGTARSWGVPSTCKLSNLLWDRVNSSCLLCQLKTCSCGKRLPGVSRRMCLNIWAPLGVLFLGCCFDVKNCPPGDLSAYTQIIRNKSNCINKCNYHTRVPLMPSHWHAPCSWGLALLW